MTDARRPVLRFSPDARLTLLFGLGAFAAAAAALLTADTAGRILFSGAAAVLVGYVLTDLIYRPRLTVSSEGITVRSPLARARLSWPEIDAVRIDERRRYGVRTACLEIDAGDTLIVLGWRGLGTDPQTAVDLTVAFDPRGAREDDSAG